MKFKDKGIVITGAASGIGFATALAFAKQGAKVMMSDIESGALESARREVVRLTGNTQLHAAVCDVGELDDVLKLSNEAFSSLGGVHVVFNNAGVGVSGRVTHMRHSDWEWVLRVNLWGAIHGVEAFTARMVEQAEGGHMVFNSSFAGLVYSQTLAPYCVSKAGVVALAEVLRQELRGDGIGVSVVCPMRIATKIGSSARNRGVDFGGQEGSPELIDPCDTSLPGEIADVDATAARIIKGIEANELYVMTHGEARPYIAKRFDKIDSAFDRQFPAL